MSPDTSNELSEKEKNLVLVDQENVELDGSDTSSEEVSITEPFDPSKIRVETKNTQMDALIKRLKNREIDLAPDFQRKAGIWKDEAQCRLIESMLIKIPLPAFYMDASDDNKWLVVDGLQRLTAVRRFVIDQELALTGLEFLVDYNGCKFDDLPRSLQRRIEETDIVVYQIQPGTPHRVKFDIFRRINTGGEPLSAQEIRHALNQGKITKFLTKMANSNEFKRATVGGVSAKRMDDRECVVRFLAFCSSSVDEYKVDNFDSFLNDAMAAANKMADEELERLGKRFLRTMKAAHKIFTGDAFRKRYSKIAGRHPINKALFEAWSVNLDLLTDEEIEKLIDRKEQLKNLFIEKMNTDDFDKSVSQGTGSVSRVKTRFNTVKTIIEEVLA
jgi:Protein of unknown function DUF262